MVACGFIGFEFLLCCWEERPADVTGRREMRDVGLEFPSVVQHFRYLSCSIPPHLRTSSALGNSTAFKQNRSTASSSPLSPPPLPCNSDTKSATGTTGDVQPDPRISSSVPASFPNGNRHTPPIFSPDSPLVIAGRRSQITAQDGCHVSSHISHLTSHLVSHLTSHVSRLTSHVSPHLSPHLSSHIPRRQTPELRGPRSTADTNGSSSTAAPPFFFLSFFLSFFFFLGGEKHPL